jgi:hypothetical protein
MTQTITDQASGARTATDVAYWAYHLLRMSAFAISSSGGVLGIAAVTGSAKRADQQLANGMATTPGRKMFMVCLLSRPVARAPGGRPLVPLKTRVSAPGTHALNLPV